jgi:flagellar basal-body rod protein FlgG
MVMQGYLELSNVRVIKEMVSMIETTRAYESYLKALKAYDDMEQQSNQDVGSVT